MLPTIKKILKIADKPQKTRVWLFSIFCVLLYSSTLIGLLVAWYQVDTSVPFHWFDDSKGWKYVDKFGHAFTAFVECSLLYKVWNWTGLSKNRCLAISAFMAFFSQSSYEIFDGFSAGYGASLPDIVANALGVLLYMTQIILLKKLIVDSKFSFHPTIYAHMRPSFFGEHYLQQFLKDYNGQTYWFTLDINQLLNKKILPSWLFLSVGYGADGLLGGDDNIWTSKDGTIKDFSHIERASRFMITIDFNWALIKNPTLNAFAQIFNYVKFPAPTLEFNTDKGVIFHWLYF